MPHQSGSRVMRRETSIVTLGGALGSGAFASAFTFSSAIRVAPFLLVPAKDCVPGLQPMHVNGREVGGGEPLQLRVERRGLVNGIGVAIKIPTVAREEIE